MPIVIFFLLESTFVYLSLSYVKPWLDTHLAFGDDWSTGLAGLDVLLKWLLGALAWAGKWAGTLAAAALGWIVSLLLSPPLSAPALERLVDIVERDLGAPPRAPLGFLAEFGCGIRSMLMSSAVTVPIILGLTLLELVFAPAAVVATPLKLLVGALGVAWSLFDYPLTLRGVGARQRIALIRQNITLVLGFGTAFALVALVPCCSVVMLPVGVVAATQLLAEIERALPAPVAKTQ